MRHPTVASLVKWHVRLHTAQRILEMYSAGESFAPYIEQLSPEMRRHVSGLLCAAAESWNNALADYEREESGDGIWLR